MGQTMRMPCPRAVHLWLSRALIDDARRENAFGLMMSLNMLFEFGDAFDYAGSDFAGWCREVEFRYFKIIPLTGPSSAAVAYK
jgi:hypothetical protein